MTVNVVSCVIAVAKKSVSDVAEIPLVGEGEVLVVRIEDIHFNGRKVGLVVGKAGHLADVIAVNRLAVGGGKTAFGKLQPERLIKPLSLVSESCIESSFE